MLIKKVIFILLITVTLGTSITAAWFYYEGNQKQPVGAKQVFLEKVTPHNLRS